MLSQEEINVVAGIMQKCLISTTRDYAEGDVGGEEDFSGQFIGRLKNAIENLRSPSAKWRVAEYIAGDDVTDQHPRVRISSRQLRKRAEEPWAGADIVVVLSIELRDYKVSKGLLIQAKLAGENRKLLSSTTAGLRKQCTDMLNLSASSFVFLYSTSHTEILAATSVEAARGKNLSGLIAYPDPWFFHDFIACWIGDPRLSATGRQALEALRKRARARSAVLIEATDPELKAESEQHA